MSDQLIDLSHMAAKPFKGLDLLFKSVWGRLFIVHFVMQLDFTGGGSNIWFILALAVLIANHSR